MQNAVAHQYLNGKLFVCLVAAHRLNTQRDSHFRQQKLSLEMVMGGGLLYSKWWGYDLRF